MNGAAAASADPIALWVVPVAEIGGVARHVLDAVAAGIPGWRIFTLTPPGPLADAVREIGGAALTGAFGPDHGLRASVATLRHTVTRLRPAVVHTHLAYADLVAAATLLTGPHTGPRTGPRLVSTEHGIAGPDLVYHRSPGQARAMAWAHRARVERYDALIAVSQATAAAMREKWHPRGAVTVIPNGVDRVPPGPTAPGPTVPGQDPPGLRILSLARLAPEKRIDLLLDAFALVARTHPEAHLTLAGIGPDHDRLRAQVASLGLTERVQLPGFVDPARALAAADVVAMLSVWENCSYTLLDAIARHRGVVATAVGGNPELLPPQCLVGDATNAPEPDQVAARLITQGLQPSERPALPSDWPTVAEMTGRIAAIYGQVLSSAGGRWRPWR